MNGNLVAKLLFFACIAASAVGFLPAPAALAAGLAVSLTVGNPYEKQSRKLAKTLLQASVVALGFGMNIGQVVHAGAAGFLYTALGIGITTTFGLLFGELLKVDRGTSYLVTAGTAICGGSAIAAVGPIIAATEVQMAVSLGTVFILNAIALFIFPPIGQALHLTQPQFGLWAALAIHDTSSVVGAAERFGPQALAIATTVKLARALWIVPISLAALLVEREGKQKVQWPWFILFFCFAAGAKTLFPGLAPLWTAGFKGGRLGLTVTLFLIGCGLSLKNLKIVGVRPLGLGIALWVISATGSLAAVYYRWIAI